MSRSEDSHCANRITKLIALARGVRSTVKHRLIRKIIVSRENWLLDMFTPIIINSIKLFGKVLDVE